MQFDTVMKFLHKNGLRVRLKNFFFMQPRIEILGDLFDADGDHVDSWVSRPITAD